jgi:predicted N-acyltransferase
MWFDQAWNLFLEGAKQVAADPGLSRAVARFLEEERRQVQGGMDWLAEEYSPFKAA